LVDTPLAAPATAPSGRPLDSFDLPEAVRVGIRAAGFTHCTPIQEQVLPLALAGRDYASGALAEEGEHPLGHGGFEPAVMEMAES